LDSHAKIVFCLAEKFFALEQVAIITGGKNGCNPIFYFLYPI